MRGVRGRRGRAGGLRGPHPGSLGAGDGRPRRPAARGVPQVRPPHEVLDLHARGAGGRLSPPGAGAPPPDRGLRAALPWGCGTVSPAVASSKPVRLPCLASQSLDRAAQEARVKILFGTLPSSQSSDREPSTWACGCRVLLESGRSRWDSVPHARQPLPPWRVE